METHDGTPLPGAARWSAGNPYWRDALWTARPIGHAEAAAEPGARTSGTASAGPMLWSMGLLMGAAAMYLLDAENGERRRAAVARRVDQYRDEVERTIDRERAQVREQLRGTTREALRRVRERFVSDEEIRREIIIRMEDVLPFEEAGMIQVAVRRGHVTLEGSIAEDRLNRLLGRVATAPGVRGLDNRLTVRASTPS